MFPSDLPSLPTSHPQFYIQMLRSSLPHYTIYKVVYNWQPAPPQLSTMVGWGFTVDFKLFRRKTSLIRLKAPLGQYQLLVFRCSSITKNCCCKELRRALKPWLPIWLLWVYLFCAPKRADIVWHLTVPWLRIPGVGVTPGWAFVLPSPPGPAGWRELCPSPLAKITES